MADAKTVTIADVLAEIRRQLEWRGPHDTTQGHVVLTREMAQYAHELMIAVIVERDELAREVLRSRITHDAAPIPPAAK